MVLIFEITYLTPWMERKP